MQGSHLTAKVLTGIKPTGQFHLGNYVGAIRPSLSLVKKSQKAFLFIADAHALTHVHDGNKMRQNSLQAAATWMACGLDPDQCILYRQSDVPEVFELYWILACFTPKGLMNRAHAYKAALQAGSDPDAGVGMGLFSYPVLMAADILLFSATHVPVGEDQSQHLEYCRDIAQKFNSAYKTQLLTIPQAIKSPHSLSGLDGRKMSKSYNNHIPLFLDKNPLQKRVNKIQTDSTAPEAPKDPETSHLMHMYKAFASAKEVQELGQRYAKGIGWGEVKKILGNKIFSYFEKQKTRYDNLMQEPEQIHRALKLGAQKARKELTPLRQKLRSLVGF